MSQTYAPTTAKRRGRVAVPLLVGAVSLAIGLAIGTAANRPTAQPTSATVAAAPTPQQVNTPTTAPKTSAAVKTSPAKAPPPPPPSITDGMWTVGVDFPAGRYRTTANVGSDCYWEIDRSGTNGHDIVDNDLPSGGRPSVTLKKGQDFKTQDCGKWSKVG